MPFAFDAHRLTVALQAHGYAVNGAAEGAPNVVHGRRRDGAEIWIDAGGRLRYQTCRRTQAGQTRRVSQDGMDYRVLSEPYALITITVELGATAQLADALAALDDLAYDAQAS
ncbi:MAG: hypothetical protein U0822_23540 [Anaerolineae bacterium]